MIQLSTKEHLVYFMQTGVLRLSNYDLKFVQNLNHFILQQKAITSNQIALFEKLILKYEKQFKKQNLPLNFLDSLPWTTKIVASDPIYTDAYISIVEDNIHFKAPYNKNFITNFRKLDYNPYIWKKEVRRYEAPFSTMALKILVQLVHYFYPIVHYCGTTKELLNTTKHYDNVKYWQPTLVKINDNYIVVASNKNLDDAIKHIPLNSNLDTMVTLVDYGVTMDVGLAEDKDILKFVNEYIYETNLENLDKVFEYLKKLGCDGVYFSGHSLLIKKEVKEKILAVTKNIHNLTDVSVFNKTLRSGNYKFPVVLQFSSIVSTSKLRTCGIRKVIKIINSNPIDIK
jgi:hypothetical protein